MPATDPKADRYQEFNTTWCGICLTIRHLAERFAGMDHIEMIIAERVALPVTETHRCRSLRFGTYALLVDLKTSNLSNIIL